MGIVERAKILAKNEVCSNNQTYILEFKGY